MSKLSFRARAVDTSKQMPVFLAEELPDLSEYASINRAVPQMPTGMEKEEEMELHLQQAISAQQKSSTGAAVPNENAIIPIPKVTSDVKYYERLYPSDYKLPKQLIKVQAALNLEPEIPDYDLDSEDERWLSTHGQKIDVSPLQFERIMDTLEKQSEFKVITPSEAKLLLQEDDDMLLAVYDYWLTKRYMAASQGKNLIPRVKTEKRDGTGAKHNPYVAFRRRAEKMQTRKNRRNDEESYEKILKLRHDLQKAVTLAEMVKRREKSKREMINLTLDIVEKRFILEDFRDELFSLICNEAKPSFRFSKQEMVVPTPLNNKKSPPAAKKRKAPSTVSTKEDKGLVSREWLLQNAEEWNRPPASFLQSPKATATTSEIVSTCRVERELVEPEGRYAFKRRRGCRYYAPTSSSATESSEAAAVWPWEQPRDRVCYFPTYLHSRYATSSTANANGMNGLRFIGFCRRRVGRGGRIMFDRSSWSPSDQSSAVCGDFPSTSAETVVHRHTSNSNRTESLYFRPTSPLQTSELDEDEFELASSIPSHLSSPSPGDASSTVGSQGVPFATVIGPQGILRLPLTIGSLAPAPEEQQQSHRNSPIPSSTSARQQKNSNVESSHSVQKQSNEASRVSGDSPRSTPTKDRNRKRSSNVANSSNSAVFAQPAQPDAPNSSYLHTRSENTSGVGGGDSKPAVDGNGGLNQWRKQQDFGATTALLMRPPVRLPISANQNFESARPQQQQREPRGQANRPAQVHGIAASPTMTTSNSNNFALVTTFKGSQDMVGSGNNGKFGLGVVAANAIGKAGSPHPPASAHTYALPPADYFGRQNVASQQVQTLPRNSSSGTLMASDAQYESGPAAEHAMTNGPAVERSPRRRAYGARTQQPVTPSAGPAPSKMATQAPVVPSPPANLPLDHGSYHASGFMPPPVAVVSAPSISSAGTPVASAAPAVALANGSKDEQPPSCAETAITAQYNGQRNYREDAVSANASPSSSTGVVELTHPLPTPSPSPNARFLNITDAGGLIAPKLEEMQVKASVSSVVGRLTPTTVGKNRKSSDE